MFQHVCRYNVDGNSIRLYDAVPCGIMHCCPSGNGSTLFANKTACSILGYEDFPDFIARRGRTALSHIPERDRSIARRCIEDLVAGTRESCEFYHRITRGDGTTGWIRGTAALVEGGACPIIQAAFNDVTALHVKRYERDRSRYAEVLRTAFAEVYEINMEKRFVRLLSSTAHADDAAGPKASLQEAFESWKRYTLRSEERDRVIAAIKEFIAGRESSSTVAYRLTIDDEARWCQSTLLRMGDEGILCCNQDVTERMRTEDEKLSRNLGYIVSRLPVGIGMFSLRDGKAIPRYVSEPVCTMLGYTREEFYEQRAQQPLFDANPRDFGVDDDPSSTEVQCGSVGLEVELQRKDGAPRMARLRGTAFRTRSGETELFAAIADVTEEMRAQHARAWQNERYRILSELTRAISFDYNSETDAALLYTDAGNGITAQSIPHYLENLELARAGIVHPDSLSAVRELFESTDGRRTAVLEYQANYRGGRVPVVPGEPVQG